MDLHVEEYLRFEREPAYRATAENCVDEAEKRLMFSKRIAFGTAGLRGPMRAGISGMNCGTVWRASQGLCEFWVKKLGLAECQKRGAVVGFDGRHNSEYLASVVAAVFMSKGVPVLFADEVTATPITPYLIVAKGAFCGVQVTASHNPKNDNGYKVYADNGAQIIPPMDREIAAEIEAQCTPWLAVDAIVDHQLRRLNPIHPARPLARLMLAEGWRSMKSAISAELLVPAGCLRESKLKVVYTAMHGVGYRYVKDLIVDELGFPAEQFIPVAAQMYPDPEFPTVKFPNPEEKGALDLAKACAAEMEADLVIANDPDADRFAAAERQRDGSWRMFTGDELGALLGMIAYETWEAKTSGESKCSFVCSAVSGTFLERYALPRRAVFRETLTGFKWMVNVALGLEASEGIEPCFCYEEALGYGLCVKTIPDKCGLTAAAAFVKKASALASGGVLMAEWLESEMARHGGYFATENSYYIAQDPSVTKAVIAGFRERFGRRLETSEGLTLAGYRVTRIRDLGADYDSAGKKAGALPALDEMLTLYFENGARLTLRGSGTEPKLKYYSEMVSPVSVASAKEELKVLVEAVLLEVLKPHELARAASG